VQEGGPVMPNEEPTTEEREHKIALVLACILMTFQILVSTALFLYMVQDQESFHAAMMTHFGGMLGNIMATMTSIVVVVIFRVAAGPIEFETPLGFKFKGASGPVVLWVFTYLATICGISVLWNMNK
jgi:hypothetical protein